MHGEGLLIAWSLVVLALVLGSATKREDDDLTFWHYTDLPPSLQSCRNPNGRKGFCPEEIWEIRKAAVDRMFNDEPNPNFIMLHLQDPSPEYPAKAVEHDQSFSLYLKKKFPETVILPILGTEGFSGKKNKDRYKLWSEYLPPGEERDTFEKCGYYSIRLDPSASSTPSQRWSGVEAGTAKFLALNMDPEAKDGVECDGGSWVRSQLNNVEKEGPTLISSYLYPSAEVDASPLSIIVPNPLNKGAGENWKNFEPVLTAPEWATKFGEIFGNKNDLNASDILSTLVHEMTPKFFRRESEKNDSQKVEDILVQVMHIGDQNDVVVNFNITIVLIPVGIPPLELWLKQEEDPFGPVDRESTAEMVKDILNKLVPDLQAKGSKAEQTLDPILIAQVIDYETIREMMEKKLGNISHLIGPNHRLKDVEEQLKAGSNLVLAFKSSMDPKATVEKYKEKMRRLMGTEKSPLHILEYANGWTSTLGNHGDEEVLLKNSMDLNSGNPNNLRLYKSENADPRSTQFLQYGLVSDSFIPMYWSKDGLIYDPSKNIRKGVLAAPSIQNLFNLQQDPSRDDTPLDPNIGGTGSWEQFQPWYGKGILSDNIEGQLKQYLDYGDKFPMVPRNGPSEWKKKPFWGYPVPDKPFWNPEEANNAFVNFKKTESNDEEDYEAGNIERADFWNPANYYDESIFGLEGAAGDPENKNEPFWQKYNPGNKFWKNGLKIQNQASRYFGPNIPFIGMVQQQEDDAEGRPPQGGEEGVERNAFRPKNYLGYGKKFRDKFNNLVRPYFDVEKPFFGPDSDNMVRSGPNDLGDSSRGKPFTTTEDKNTVGEGRAFWKKYVPELKYPFNSLNPYYQGGQSGEEETPTSGGNLPQGVQSVQRKNEKPWAKKRGFDDNEKLERKSRGIYADDVQKREGFFESFSPWKTQDNNSGTSSRSE